MSPPLRQRADDSSADQDLARTLNRAVSAREDPGAICVHCTALGAEFGIAAHKIALVAKPPPVPS